jgi:hypothetical protein
VTLLVVGRIVSTLATVVLVLASISAEGPGGIPNSYAGALTELTGMSAAVLLFLVFGPLVERVYRKRRYQAYSRVQLASVATELHAAMVSLRELSTLGADPELSVHDGVAVHGTVWPDRNLEKWPPSHLRDLLPTLATDLTTDPPYPDDWLKTSLRFKVWNPDTKSFEPGFWEIERTPQQVFRDLADAARHSLTASELLSRHVAVSDDPGAALAAEMLRRAASQIDQHDPYSEPSSDLPEPRPDQRDELVMLGITMWDLVRPLASAILEAISILDDDALSEFEKPWEHRVPPILGDEDLTRVAALLALEMGPDHHIRSQ